MAMIVLLVIPEVIMETECRGCKAVREFISNLKNKYGTFSKEEKVEGDMNEQIKYAQNKINELINKVNTNGEK
jgi:hypothetical protein